MIKRYDHGTRVDRFGDVVSCMDEYLDGVYVALSDVVEIIEAEISEWRPAERSGSYEAAQAIDALTALLDHLRGVATPVRAAEGES